MKETSHQYAGYLKLERNSIKKNADIRQWVNVGNGVLLAGNDGHGLGFQADMEWYLLGHPE